MRIASVLFLFFSLSFLSHASSITECTSVLEELMEIVTSTNLLPESSGEIKTKEGRSDLMKETRSLKAQYKNLSLVQDSVTFLSTLSSFEKAFEDSLFFGEKDTFSRDLNELISKNESLDYEIDSLVITSSLFKNSMAFSFANSSSSVSSDYKERTLRVFERLVSFEDEKDFFNMPDRDFFTRITRFVMIFSGPNGNLNEDFFSQEQKKDFAKVIYHFINTIIKKSKTDATVMHSIKEYALDYKEFLEKFSSGISDFIDRDYAVNLISLFERMSTLE